ncbi:unnamed protein product [Prorocentrum cordatum]|uniref:Uncharacterized protein n=1 Tax=Prorocentrum cordatum TaxID=2364126 RepID=A0ABN9PP30_9DINO|nr:unnamed protein product [Polarella glacialis]
MALADVKLHASERCRNLPAPRSSRPAASRLPAACRLAATGASSVPPARPRGRRRPEEEEKEEEGEEEEEEEEEENAFYSPLPSLARRSHGTTASRPMKLFLLLVSPSSCSAASASESSKQRNPHPRPFASHFAHASPAAVLSSQLRGEPRHTKASEFSELPVHIFVTVYGFLLAPVLVLKPGDGKLRGHQMKS